MRKPIPEIKESVAVLIDKLRSEPKGRRKTRLQVLYLLKSGQAHTREQVAQLVAVNRHTVGQWLEKYEKGGVGGMVEIQTHSNRQAVIGPEVRQALVDKLKAQKGFGSYGEVLKWLKEEFGVAVKYKTLHGLIHYGLKGKLKVPRSSHVKKTKLRSKPFVKG